MSPKYKKRIFLIGIIHLVCIYLVMMVYHTHHPIKVQWINDPFFTFHPYPSTPRWMDIWNEIHIAIPGLFMILSWVSYTERKKAWYLFFLILGLLDLRNVVLERSENVTLLIGYIAMIIVFLLIPFLYKACIKKKWRFCMLNIVVFFAAIHREIIEVVELVIGFYRQGLGLNCLKIPAIIFITLLKYINRQTFALDLVGTLLYKFENLFAPKLIRLESLPDYFWYIKIFIFAAILIWNVFWGYEKRNSEIKEKICRIKMSGKEVIFTVVLSLLAVFCLSVDVYVCKYITNFHYQNYIDWSSQFKDK